jgi:hypothetical protein
MFHNFDDIDWAKAILVLTGIGLFYGTIQALTPDWLDKWVLAVSGGCLAMFTYFLNASRRK